MIPPKKIQPDPDYEIIEFGQQYSNAPMSKNQSKLLINNIKQLNLIEIYLDARAPLKCELCGSLQPKTRCAQCNNQALCESCDDMYHRHPKRKTHVRKV